MASADDVAAYILSKQGEMTAMKLQKLCYYSHAWHLVWEEKPLFPERIEAWANGPVVRALYAKHRRQWLLADWPWGRADYLRPDEQSSIDAVLEFYGARSAHELSELTHREAPWRETRGDLPAGAVSDRQIADRLMYEYYDGLTSTGE